MYIGPCVRPGDSFMDIMQIAMMAMQSQATLSKSNMIAGFMKQNSDMAAKTVETLLQRPQQSLAPAGRPGSIISRYA